MNPRGLAQLIRWLGPWSDAGALPPGIARERWTVRAGLDAYVYRPRRAVRASYLIAPGLHFLGPDDPRMDRFCRVLSAAGFTVVAPFLPDYLALVVAPGAPDDLEAVARATLARERGPLALFSISFGSWPALEVAARLGDACDGVVTFGGYADFASVVRFCVQPAAGEGLPANDPLNPPALFVNLIGLMQPPLPPGDVAQLSEAWREMTRRTWGRMELKAPGRLSPFIAEVAAGLPEHLRARFRIGCNDGPGGAREVDDVLARAGSAFAFADPAHAAARLTCPVVICHGRDDDVIPWSEAGKLAALLSPHVPVRTFVTGLYGHTGAGKPGAGALLREGLTLLRMARAIANGGSLRATIRS